MAAEEEEEEEEEEEAELLLAMEECKSASLLPTLCAEEQGKLQRWSGVAERNRERAEQRRNRVSSEKRV